MKIIRKKTKGVTSNPKVLVVDLITGESRIIDKIPYLFGSSNTADWQIPNHEGENSNQVQITHSGKNSAFALSPHYFSESPMLLDGALFQHPSEMVLERGMMLKIHGYLLGVVLTKKPEEFLQRLNLGEWMVFEGVTNEVLGTVSLHEIPTLVSSSPFAFENCAFSLPSLGAPGAWLRDLADIFQPQHSDAEGVSEPEPPPFKEPDSVEEVIRDESIPSDVGEFQCPICWLNFEGKHIKHIATHEELMGDPVLGQDQLRRFIPKKWDFSGTALDDYGLPCPDTACPHCHQRLPAGFGEFKQYIFSIVGAPSSGKSYYLAILLKSLKRFLFHKFEISFLDQDPEYNILINDVINTLFSAKSASEGRIVKTDMRGGNYKNVTRSGQEVNLPKPSIFNISQTNVENTDSSLVFYDNAGEHFLPSYSGAGDFEILHVAKASSLFFLYDPLVNIDIKQALVGVDSDQLKQASVADQQATILSQMNVKISRALSKPTSEKLESPFALVVGKCDIWHSLVPKWSKIVNPIGKDGLLNQSAIDSNSSIVRGFLNEYAPDVVATAERLSRVVRYFPVSSFGHKPKSHQVKDEQGNPITDIAPDPARIKPYMIELPTVWALSQTIPDLIPDKLS